MGLGLIWTYETDRTRKTFLESPESGKDSTNLKIRAPFVPATKRLTSRAKYARTVSTNTRQGIRDNIEKTLKPERSFKVNNQVAFDQHLMMAIVHSWGSRSRRTAVSAIRDSPQAKAALFVCRHDHLAL